MVLGKTDAALIMVFGALIGVAATLGYTNHQIDSLEQSIGEQNSFNNYQQNYTGLTGLFSDVEESVVSVNVPGAEQSQGSGFAYTESHIVTNHHVVSGSETVEITFTDGSTENAEVSGVDPYTDLAVLETDRDDLKPLETGDLDNVNVGQQAVAIGNPFGFQSSMTAGIISQRDRLLPVQGGFSIPNVLQTDAAINPGNSGGPLMNTQGEVVGVNTAIETDTGVFSGVGFAISADSVERVVPELIDSGRYEHAWLGVSGTDVGPEIVEEMSLENSSGFLVSEVVEDGPSENILREGDEITNIQGQEIALGGDVIIGIDGNEVRGIEDVLVYLARETEPGDSVEIEVIRDGEVIELTVNLDSRPEISAANNAE